VPVLAAEQGPVQEIAAELNKLAKTVGGFARGTDGTRGAGPARSIVESLRTINATMDAAAKSRSLGSAGFNTIGREFEKIGATLRGLGSDSKSAK